MFLRVQVNANVRVQDDAKSCLQDGTNFWLQNDANSCGYNDAIPRLLDVTDSSMWDNINSRVNYDANTRCYDSTYYDPDHNIEDDVNSESDDYT